MTIELMTNVPRRKFKELGIVEGNTVKSKMFIRDFFAGFRAFLGKEVIEYTDMIQQARNQAKDRMVEQAEKLGADAIVNVRYGGTSVMATASEMYAYGTAINWVEE